MKTFRFEGYSDDTFGEVAVTHDDYDNCASGGRIEYLITAASEPDCGLLITGQYCPGNSGSWLIGIANHDPDGNDRPMPDWPARFIVNDRDERYRFNPVLLIDVPDDAELRCLNRNEDED